MDLYLETFDVGRLVRDVAAVLQPLAAEERATALEVAAPTTSARCTPT